MNTQELSDLAAYFVEVTFRTGETLDPLLIKEYIEVKKIAKDDVDYFLIFVKHWFDVNISLMWSDVIMDLMIPS